MTVTRPDQHPFGEIDAKWQRRWVDTEAFQVRPEPGRAKYYCLVTLPSPSDRVPVGYVRSCTLGDAISRYKRMRGYNVLHVIGPGPVALPAADPAVEPGAGSAAGSVARMQTQTRRLGVSCDWKRTTPAGDPEGVRWSQLIFLRMLEHGLADKKTRTVSACPSSEIVVADEPMQDSRGSRGESALVPRQTEQWYFKISAYAEELLESCARLTGWPESTVTLQRNVIGRGEGTEFDLAVVGRPGLAIRVFTRRPETAFGITYAVLAPEHPLVDQLVTDDTERRAVIAFRAEVARASETERLATDRPKRGFRLTAQAVNPFTLSEVPLFLADYVVMGYGTGAVMAVPSEDHRDWEFANVYGLPTIDVQSPPGWNGQTYTGGGTIINSGFLDGLPALEARAKAIAWLAARGIGGPKVHYRIQDWGVSSQHAGGVAIPVIYCPACGTVPEKPQNLPVMLARDVEDTGNDMRGVDAPCPQCGGPARRESETMDAAVRSSWDFLRYCAPTPGDGASGPAIHDWLPVDQYVCGGEGAVPHLLYARFSTKALRDVGLLRVDEPFQNVLVPETVIKDDSTTSHGADADTLIAKYGADAVRLFALFAAPPEKTLEWSEQGVEAAFRFVSRLWRFAVACRPQLIPTPAGRPAALSAQGSAFRRLIDETILRVTRDIEDHLHFNTAISAIHELVNALHTLAGSLDRMPQDEAQSLLREGTETALLLLAPFVPHVTHELWEQLGHTRRISDEPWPTVDAAALKRDTVAIVVQVDGRVRSQLSIPPDAGEATLRAQALADDKVRSWIETRDVIRVVVVPGRLVNIVTRARS